MSIGHLNVNIPLKTLSIEGPPKFLSCNILDISNAYAIWTQTSRDSQQSHGDNRKPVTIRTETPRKK